MRMGNEGKIRVVRASEHNLKHISVEVPHGAMTVVTGVSGSGKSTLAYDVIFRESQRRFLESFSSYSRHYLGKLEKPLVEEITGLMPALAINQKTVVAHPRSTVGTLSGIYDYLRLLFARTGQGQDPPGVPLLARLFSFNSPYGACPECAGLGMAEHIDPLKLISDPSRSLRQGALVPTTPVGYIVYSQVRVDELDKVCHAHGFSVDVPWNSLSAEQQHVIWYGSDRVKILFGKHSLESRLKWKGITARPREEAYYKGMVPIMEDILKRDRNDNILRFVSALPCTACGGTRLNPSALAVRVDGRSIAEFSRLTLAELRTVLAGLYSRSKGDDVTRHILDPLLKRLEYLSLLGLDYLTADRESTTLSGGEAQRIRLASQVGTGLQGVLYLLDEPSIGLHPRDSHRLLQVLRSLRDNGNTILVVEHDEHIIGAADYLVDIGPGAAANGGQLLFQGRPQDLLGHPSAFPGSPTAQALGFRHDPAGRKATRSATGHIRITGACRHNLRHLDATFLMGAFNVVTGVSGAGKSTLVHQVLGRYLKGQTHDGSFSSISCSIPVDRVIDIDQSPIGRTPRSNPATYTNLYDRIRDLFAGQPEAVKRHYPKGRFSFNNEGGRCEQCQGAGYVQLGMHFLGDVEILCDRCHGRRFNEETLQITYRGKNICEVLEMSVEEALDFFTGDPRLTRILHLMAELGVGYLKLGQPSTTLSGGEAQRIKLASELFKTAKGHGLYILDEPSTGLHKADIRHLLHALNRIVDDGNTVIVIEHDADIIRQADHVVDLGPGGGLEGGTLVASGRPEEIATCPASFTGQALKAAQGPVVVASPEMKARQPQDIRLLNIGTHNLKNIDVAIPLNRTTVITGLSGSGKSSLAFDTLYAESRNRFTESFSSYARRMMDKVRRPELGECSGLTPAIALRQNRFSRNPRSTVGTVTEIYDLYRLLFSRLGVDADGRRTTLPASMFSFNNLEAACPHCRGLGIVTTADPGKFVTFPGKSLLDGALDGTPPGRFFGERNGQYVNTLKKVGTVKGMDFSKPFDTLSQEELHLALFGTGDEEYRVEWQFERGKRTGTHVLNTKWKGFVNYLAEDYEIKRHGVRGEAYETIMTDRSCPVCHGQRLREEALAIRFDGQNIGMLASKGITDTAEYFSSLMDRLDAGGQAAAGQAISQVLDKLQRLEELGLGYLSVDRATQTLSGGEAQRLRIAGQLVAGLCGITFVMDEPTAGLHPKDTENLMLSLDRLKDKGNTIVLVEHDPDVIARADYLIDLGPGAGENGGRIVASGSVTDILRNPGSITGRSLLEAPGAIAREPRQLSRGISIQGAMAHNLQHIDLEVPAGGIVTVTGVSGSGKTSLVFDVIAASFLAGRPVNCRKITFGETGSLVVTDQEPIGASPLSTPATSTGLSDLIRDLFANLEEAKRQGFKKSHFSFNSPEGRCPACKGMGSIRSSLDFLADVWTPCEACHGRRFRDEVLEVRYERMTIADVLELEVDRAAAVFKGQRKAMHILGILQDLGLGYLKLGQATSTLSGGETQRLKLASGLITDSPGKVLYVFDEPTTGLHLLDTEKLIKVFGKLVEKGHTVLAVEHNKALIRASDHVIDLGPGGGNQGGKVVFSGPVEELKTCQGSFTGNMLNASIPDVMRHIKGNFQG